MMNYERQYKRLKSVLPNDIVTLIINENEYKFNRQILLSKSNYFEKYLTNKNKLILYISDYQEKMLIDYLNDALQSFQEDKIEETLELAKLIEVPELAKQCHYYCKHQINDRIKKNDLDELFKYINVMVYKYPEFYKTIINHMASRLYDLILKLIDPNCDFKYLYSNIDECKSKKVYDKYIVLLKLPPKYFIDIVNNDELNCTKSSLLLFTLTYLGVHFYKNTTDPKLFEIFEAVNETIFCGDLQLTEKMYIYKEMYKHTPFPKKYLKFFKKVLYKQIFKY